jgi:hypothetical protein
LDDVLFEKGCFTRSKVGLVQQTHKRHKDFKTFFTCNLSSNLTLKVNLRAEQSNEWEKRINKKQYRSTCIVILSSTKYTECRLSFHSSELGSPKGVLLLPPPLGPKGEPHLLAVEGPNSESIPWNRFQGSLNSYKFGLSDSMTAKAYTLTHSIQ